MQTLTPQQFTQRCAEQLAGEVYGDCDHPPTFVHKSWAQFIENLPSARGVSAVKELTSSKPVRAFQLTAPHEVQETGVTYHLKSGEWYLEMSTVDGGTSWTRYEDEFVRENFFDPQYHKQQAVPAAEVPTPENANRLLTSRLLGILTQLFPGASIAQMEDAVFRGGFIAVSSRDNARRDETNSRLWEVNSKLAKEAEFTRPIVARIREVLNVDAQIATVNASIRELVAAAEANGY